MVHSEKRKLQAATSFSLPRQAHSQARKITIQDKEVFPGERPRTAHPYQGMHGQGTWLPPIGQTGSRGESLPREGHKSATADDRWSSTDAGEPRHVAEAPCSSTTATKHLMQVMMALPRADPCSTESCKTTGRCLHCEGNAEWLPGGPHSAWNLDHAFGQEDGQRIARQHLRVTLHVISPQTIRGEDK